MNMLGWELVPLEQEKTSDMALVNIRQGHNHNIFTWDYDVV